MPVLVALVALAGGAATAGAAADAEPGPGRALRSAQMDTRPLVVDTDLGPDDLVALAWLSGRPGIEIRAVTLSGTGRASCPVDLARLRAVLAALELGDVPTGCGSATPEGGGVPFPGEERAAATALHGLVLPAAPAPAGEPRTAEEVIATVLHTATDRVSLLALGPLTTFAAAVRDPDMAVRVASVTASLGALEGPGDVIPPGGSVPGPAEWNAHADPGAVSAVLRSGAPLILITADAAAAAPPSETLLEALAAGDGTPAARLVAALLAADPELRAGGWSLRDALAAVTLTDPEVAETRERMLVVTAGGPDAGALRGSGSGLPAQVAVNADRSAFEAALLAGIRGDGSRALASPMGTVVITGGADGCTLDGGDLSAAGPALIEARAPDGPLVAVLAALGEGHDLDELRAVLQAQDPATDPPEWLLLTAYLEVDAGGVAQSSAELTPGAHAAICITGDAAPPHYAVAAEILAIDG